MAISKSTTAYSCQVVDGQLNVQATSLQRNICAGPALALKKLSAGMIVVISADDMPEVQKELQAHGIAIPLGGA